MISNKKIVIFGPDNSGKTTLSQNIENYCKFSGIDVERVHSLGPASMIEQSLYMEENLSKPRTVIFDRYPCIEEKVCGVILRSYDNYESLPEVYNSYIKSIDLFIFCNPGFKAILNWGEREQMEGIKENIFELYFGYCRIYADLKKKGFNVLEYNWRIPGSIDEVLEGVSK